MDDVRYLHHHRRRRREARHQVSHLRLRHQFLSAATAFVELGAAAEEAFGSAAEAAAAFEVELMWERA